MEVQGSRKRGWCKIRCVDRERGMIPKRMDCRGGRSVRPCHMQANIDKHRHHIKVGIIRRGKSVAITVMGIGRNGSNAYNVLDRTMDATPTTSGAMPGYAPWMQSARLSVHRSDKIPFYMVVSRLGMACTD